MELFRNGLVMLVFQEELFGERGKRKKGKRGNAQQSQRQVAMDAGLELDLYLEV